VEDDELVRDMLSQTLQRASHQVITATNGQEASEILKNHHPDIMITDIIMPKMSGITLISEVKNKHPAMEIITISGGGRLDPTGYLDLSESLGAAASFEKPIDKTALLMTIDLLVHN
jgi:DNA-binding NtrC family response regulator